MHQSKIRTFRRVSSEKLKDETKKQDICKSDRIPGISNQNEETLVPIWQRQYKEN